MEIVEPGNKFGFSSKGDGKPVEWFARIRCLTLTRAFLEPPWLLVGNQAKKIAAV